MGNKASAPKEDASNANNSKTIQSMVKEGLLHPWVFDEKTQLFVASTWSKRDFSEDNCVTTMLRTGNYLIYALGKTNRFKMPGPFISSFCEKTCFGPNEHLPELIYHNLRKAWQKRKHWNAIRGFPWDFHVLSNDGFVCFRVCRDVRKQFSTLALCCADKISQLPRFTRQLIVSYAADTLTASLKREVSIPSESLIETRYSDSAFQTNQEMKVDNLQVPHAVTYGATLPSPMNAHIDSKSGKTHFPKLTAEKVTNFLTKFSVVPRPFWKYCGYRSVILYRNNGKDHSQWGRELAPHTKLIPADCFDNVGNKTLESPPPLITAFNHGEII